jgi:hemoglobin
VSTDVKHAPAETRPELNTPFHRLGGHAAMEAIVGRFYDLMDEDPAYAELRAMHAPDLAPMRKSLALFLAAWSGGPRDWFEQNPGKCMMSAHKGFTIRREIAGQWAEAMKRAIAEAGIADAALAGAMAGVLGEMALGMARPAAEPAQ